MEVGYRRTSVEEDLSKDLNGPLCDLLKFWSRIFMNRRSSAENNSLLISR